MVTHDISAPRPRLVGPSGSRTSLWRGGTGAPLLLLHGAGPGVDAELNWVGVWGALAERFDVLAPDLVGFGRTDQPGQPPCGPRPWITLRVAQILALLDALGVDRALIVGNSRGGGAVALRLAIDHPNRVGALVVMGAGGYAPKPEPDRLQEMQASATAYYDSPTPAAMEAIIRRFVSDEGHLPAPLQQLAEIRHERATAPGLERSFRAMWSGDLSEAGPSEQELGTLACPTLLLHGGDDRVAPVHASVALRAAIGGAHLHVLPHAGHWLHVDQPDIFTDSITDFFTRANTKTTRAET